MCIKWMTLETKTKLEAYKLLIAHKFVPGLLLKHIRDKYPLHGFEVIYIYIITNNSQ